MVSCISLQSNTKHSATLHLLGTKDVLHVNNFFYQKLYSVYMHVELPNWLCSHQMHLQFEYFKMCNFWESCKVSPVHLPCISCNFSCTFSIMLMNDLYALPHSPVP